jgi:hypothetical protein
VSRFKRLYFSFLIMRASEIAKRFMMAEEGVLVLKEGELSPDELEGETVKLGIRVLVSGKDRSRTFDLGALTIIYNSCSKAFASDYLDLTLSLEQLIQKYGSLTELHFLSRCVKEGKVSLTFLESMGSRDFAYLISTLS